MFNISVIYIQHFGAFGAHVLSEEKNYDIGDFFMPSGARLINDAL